MPVRLTNSDHGPDGALVMATFAADGPETCSGLPVARYSAGDLEALLDGFTVLDSRREEHLTPGGAIQPFTWIAAKRGSFERLD